MLGQHGRKVPHPQPLNGLRPLQGLSILAAPCETLKRWLNLAVQASEGFEAVGGPHNDMLAAVEAVLALLKSCY